jgi:hypothetical protein
LKATKRGLFAVALVAGLAACAVNPPPGAVFISARMGPPRPQIEVMEMRPGPGFVWIRGFYRWDGAAYTWNPGHWERRPQERAVWVPGRWRHHSRGWYWVEGRWR